MKIELDGILRDLEAYRNSTKVYINAIDKFEPGSPRRQYYEGMLDATENILQSLRNLIHEEPMKLAL